MVSIYSKIKNGLNWIKDKAFDKVIPMIGNLSDMINSDTVQGISGFATPMLNSLIPGLGSGINKGLSFLGSLGPYAKQLSSDYKNNLGLSEMANKFMSGEYNKPIKPRMDGKGIGLAKRPDELNPLIELKSDSNAIVPYRSKSYVEELDEIE